LRTEGRTFEIQEGAGEIKTREKQESAKGLRMWENAEVSENSNPIRGGRVEPGTGTDGFFPINQQEEFELGGRGDGGPWRKGPVGSQKK